jgi:hypothetical protein
MKTQNKTCAMEHWLQEKMFSDRSTHTNCQLKNRIFIPTTATSVRRKPATSNEEKTISNLTLLLKDNNQQS